MAELHNLHWGEYGYTHNKINVYSFDPELLKAHSKTILNAIECLDIAHEENDGGAEEYWSDQVFKTLESLMKYDLAFSIKEHED